MARDLSSGFIAEIEADRTQVITLVEADFESGMVYMFTGAGTLTYNGNDYIGVGNLLNISDTTETQELIAVGKSVTLSGIPSELLAIALLEEYVGRKATVSVAVLSPSGDLSVTPLFRGFMDNMSVDIDGRDTCEITMSVESEIFNLDKAVGGFYTMEDQKGRYPADKGLDLIAGIEDQQITFGRT